MTVTTIAPAVADPRIARKATPPVGAGFEGDLLLEATAGTDPRDGLRAAAELLPRRRAVAGVEWWSPDPDIAAFRCELSVGHEKAGLRLHCALGAAGTLVLIGPRMPGLELAIQPLRLTVHHWWIAER